MVELLFQKQTHAVEINDGVADVEGVNAENPGDFAAALLQCELRQWSDAKFFRRHFEGADVEILESCRVDPLGRAGAELCRDPRRFRRESERFNKTF